MFEYIIRIMDITENISHHCIGFLKLFVCMCVYVSFKFTLTFINEYTIITFKASLLIQAFRAFFKVVFVKPYEIQT